MRFLAILLWALFCTASQAQNYYAGDSITLKFTTRQSTGQPYTLAGTPAISVYKAGSTTESTAGVTLNVDYDSRTGLNNVTIDTSADGAFYANGSDYDIVITAGSVNSVSVVGEVVGHFRLGAVSSNVRQWSNSAVATPDTAGYPKVTLKVGTGQGELNITSGVVKSELNDEASLIGDIWGTGTTGFADPNTMGEALIKVLEDTSTLTENPVDANIVEVNGHTTIDSYDFAEILSLLAAVAAGDITGGASPVIKSLDGTKDRISSEVDSEGNRTNTIDVLDID